MKIEEIDKNFKVDGQVTEPDVEWFDVRDGQFDIYGLFDPLNSPRFCRLDPDIADNTSPGVSALNYHTSGGRIKFKTDSPYIALRAELKVELMTHMPASGSSGFDVYTCNNGAYRYLCAFRPWDISADAFEWSRATNGNLNDYVINMPLYNHVDKLYIGIKKGSILEHGTPYKHAKPVLYYGSSITQGGCWSRPGTCYQALISRRFDTDYINLGFSGNGKGEQIIVDYMANLDVSAFVCDYDHNAPSEQHLLDTHLNLYKTFRAAHPDTPVIFVTAPNYYCKERIEIIKATYDYAVANGDKNVSYLCGYDVIGDDCRDACFVDGIHPNDLGFYRMAKAIGDELEVYLHKNAKK